MKVFISWSGGVSRGVASVFREYLPLVIQGLSPFMSKHDIESGGRWSAELSSELAETNFGILCLTRENLTSPWLLYEAGALTKLVEGRACGILFQTLTPADITGPLAQFQHRIFCANEIRSLFFDLNSHLAQPLQEAQLNSTFAKFWPDIEARCNDVVAEIEKTSTKEPIRRDQYDVLVDVLVTVRDIERRLLAANSETVGGAIMKNLLALPDEDFQPLTNLVSIHGRPAVCSLEEFSRDASTETIKNLQHLGIVNIAEREGQKIVQVHDLVAQAIFALIPIKLKPVRED